MRASVDYYNHADRVSQRRRRSGVDGLLRFPCSCGRLIAEDQDWSDIQEGERDDLCWGFGANHEAPWPEQNTDMKGEA